MKKMCQILYVLADRRLESKECEQLGKITEPFERTKKSVHHLGICFNNVERPWEGIGTIGYWNYLESWGERWTILKDLLSIHYYQCEKCLVLIIKFGRKNLANTLEEVRIRKRIEVIRMAFLESSIILRRVVKY